MGIRRKDPHKLKPEARLWWLLFRVSYTIVIVFWPAHTDMSLVVPLLPLGLLGFAWTSFGPPTYHWMGPLSFACLIAIANVSPLSFRLRSSSNGFLT